MIVRDNIDRYQRVRDHTINYRWLCCYQNGPVERVNRTLEQEFLCCHWKSFNELKWLVKQSVNVHHHLRPHVSLGMKIPEEAQEKASSLRELA